MQPKLKAVWLSPRPRAALIASLVTTIAVVGGWRSGAFANQPAEDAAGAAAGSVPAEGEGETAVPADPTKVTIVFATVPPANATVTWGKVKLGRIKPRQPLVLTRPRDSGPLDVVVRAPGYLPVQTRAHTFSDLRVHVKLTPLSQKATLLGYRAPLDAGMGLGDGGVPEPLEGMPPSLGGPTLAPAVAGQPAQPQPGPLPQPAVQPQPTPQPAPPAQPSPATPAAP